MTTLNGDSLLGFANGQSVDGTAESSIRDAGSHIDRGIEDYSEDTLNIQNSLIDGGYGDYLGASGADGRMGPLTRSAMALQQADNNKINSANSVEATTPQQKTKPIEENEEFQTPVYSSGFGNRFG